MDATGTVRRGSKAKSVNTSNTPRMAVANSAASVPSAPSRSISRAPSEGEAACASRLGMASRPMMAGYRILAEQRQG